MRKRILVIDKVKMLNFSVSYIVWLFCKNELL